MKTLTEMYNAKRNKKEHPMITGLKKTMGSSCHKKNGYFEGGSTMPNQEQTIDMNHPMNRTMKMKTGGKACARKYMGGGIPTRSPLGGNKAFKKGGKNA